MPYDQKHPSEPTTVYRGKLVLTKTQVHGKSVLFASSHPRDVIQKHHMAGRFYEEEELEIIRRFMPMSSVFADIGSNCGNHTVFVGLFLKPRKIICIEPNPAIVPTLQANVQLNDLEDVCDLSHLGIGLGKHDCDGLGAMFRNRNVGAATLAEGEGDISVRRGDDIFKDQDIDFMKIDVEGMELDVLEGCTETISRCRPTIFVECQNANIDAVEASLAPLGYRTRESYRRYRQNINLLLVAGEI